MLFCILGACNTVSPPVSTTDNVDGGNSVSSSINGSCDCPICAGLWPSGKDSDCIGIDAECNWFNYPVNAPCMSGVGYCDGQGNCVRPAQCEVHVKFMGICHDDLDCEDGNPCTLGDCPEPECGECHQQALPDGTSCGPQKQCHGGACCSVKE